MIDYLDSIDIDVELEGLKRKTKKKRRKERLRVSCMNAAIRIVRSSPIPETLSPHLRIVHIAERLYQWVTEKQTKKEEKPE